MQDTPHTVYLIYSKSAEATRSPESISLKLCEDISEILLNFSEIQTNLSTHDCAKNLIKKVTKSRKTSIPKSAASCLKKNHLGT